MKRLMFIFLISLLFVAVAAKADPMESDTLWTMHFGVSVQSVVFSPDGKYVYAGAEWRYPRKIDALTGEIVKEYDFRELNLIKKQYHSLDISADGKYLAVSTGDYPVVSILDEASGEIYRNFAIPQEYINIWKNDIFVRSIDLSPDFTNIAICSGGWWNAEIDVRIFIYDIASGELLNTLNNGSVSKIEYSPSGDKLALIQYGGENAVSYYDTQTWKRTKLGNHSDLGTDISFSPDGTKLASCGWDGYIKIWSMNENKLETQFDYHSSNQSFISIKYIGLELIIAGTQNNVVNYLFFINPLTNKEILKKETIRADDFDINFEYDFLILADYGYLHLFSLNKILGIHAPYVENIILSPNPNTAISTINITLPIAENIEIKIINQEGIEIGSIFSGILEAGEHNFTWDGSNYPSGVYYCRITGKDLNKTLKIILEK